MSEQASDTILADDAPPPYQPTAPTTAAFLPSETAPSAFLHVYRISFGNYKILLNNQTPAFYINTRTFRTPDLTIHRGNGDYDCEVAHCVFPEAGNLYAINLFQEVNNRSTITQSRMTLDRRFSATVPVPDATGAAISTERAFEWRQAEGLLLVDGETGEVAATMHGVSFGLAKCFVLGIQARYGYSFDVLVVASAMVIYESQRREYSTPRCPRRAAHHAAGSQAGFAGAVGGGGF